EIGDGEIEDFFGVAAGARRQSDIVDVDQQVAVGTCSAAQRAEGERVELDVGRLGAGRSAGRAHDIGFGSAVLKELLDRVAQLAVGGEAAVQPLEIPEAEDLLGAVVDAAFGVAHKGGDRGSDTGDAMDGADKLLDVDARIGKGRRHRIVPSDVGP